MGTDKPYQQMTSDLYAINRENLIMDQTSFQQPPGYNGNEIQGSASAPTPQIITVGTPGALPPGMPVMPQPVGPTSCQITCPHCRCRIETRVSHHSTSKTHIACLLLSWTLCCCCLPYCMNSCRNANHFCPMCGAFIGTYAS